MDFVVSGKPMLLTGAQKVNYKKYTLFFLNVKNSNSRLLRMGMKVFNTKINPKLNELLLACTMHLCFYRVVEFCDNMKNFDSPKSIQLQKLWSQLWVENCLLCIPFVGPVQEIFRYVCSSFNRLTDCCSYFAVDLLESKLSNQIFFFLFFKKIFLMNWTNWNCGLFCLDYCFSPIDICLQPRMDKYSNMCCHYATELRPWITVSISNTICDLASDTLIKPSTAPVSYAISWAACGLWLGPLLQQLLVSRLLRNLSY